jgi:predicted O-methyltransferase YrrM
METVWTQVDDYFTSRLVASDDALDAALADSAAGGLPAINVTPTQGKLLHLLALLRGARRILEIGTLGGYSTIWMARALPAGGELVTLEIDAKHAAVAERNLARAGVADRVRVLVAPATKSLADLAARGAEPFDLVFIDADKVNSAVYFTAALQLSHEGTLIVVDNVVRKGDVVSGSSADVRGIRDLTELLASDDRVSSTAVQTVGSKGYDGFILTLVVRSPTEQRGGG